jgi:hypothetical protein
MSKRAWISILWPAFLSACAFELVVFALVDPADLHWGRDGVGLSRQAIYTLSFFVFWTMAACSGALTVAFLTKPPEEPVTRPD